MTAIYYYSMKFYYQQQQYYTGVQISHNIPGNSRTILSTLLIALGDDTCCPCRKITESLIKQTNPILFTLLFAAGSGGDY